MLKIDHLKIETINLLFEFKIKMKFKITKEPLLTFNITETTQASIYTKVTATICKIEDPTDFKKHIQSIIHA